MKPTQSIVSALYACYVYGFDVSTWPCRKDSIGTITVDFARVLDSLCLGVPFRVSVQIDSVPAVLLEVSRTILQLKRYFRGNGIDVRATNRFAKKSVTFDLVCAVDTDTAAFVRYKASLERRGQPAVLERPEALHESPPRKDKHARDQIKDGPTAVCVREQIGREVLW